MASVKQRHHLDGIRPLVSGNDNMRPTTEYYECPICFRDFVHELNFVKHLAAAGCSSQPPCKKSRKQEPKVQETFKSNTLPRPSRSSKKVTRSNSTKLSRKKTAAHVNDNVLPECVATKTDITCEFSSYQDLSRMTLAAQQQMLSAKESGEFCDFCQLQTIPGVVSQRHRLAHALVIQLTRCLELSVINSRRETDSAVLTCLSDQVRVNFSDCNWLRQAVKEVEQVLDWSNVDADIRQRHGVRDDTEFQNIVELLMTKEPHSLHQNPPPEALISSCGDTLNIPVASFVSYYPPHDEHLPNTSSSVCMSTTCNRSQVTSRIVNPNLQSVSSDFASLANSPVNQASSLDVGHHSDDSFTEIHQVERQMAGLLFETFPCPGLNAIQIVISYVI